MCRRVPFLVHGRARIVSIRNSLLLDAGAEYTAPSRLFAAATFQGEFSDNVQSYAGKVKIGITW